MSPNTPVTTETLDTAIQIVDTLVNHQVDTSLSFILDDHGHKAAAQALAIFKENYPSNYTNMKTAVLDLFAMFSSASPGTPLNVYLEEDDIKALQYAIDVLERERE